MKNCPWAVIVMIAAICGGWQLPAAWGADDVAAEVRASAERFAKQFSAGQVKELAALFTESGELIDERGTIYQGRKEISDLFTRYFTKFPGAALAMEIESIRAIDPGLAIEEGTRYLTAKEGGARAQTRYSAVKKKVGGEWLIASIREFNDDPAPTPQERLQPLAWLVGDWINEGSDAVVRISYRWSDDANYLLGDYAIQIDGKAQMKSTQRIGWDPVAQKVRSWLFDADGGFSEGQWTPVEGGWLVKSNTIIADGRTGSATLRFTPKGSERFLLAGTDRVIGDEPAASFEVAVAKKPAADKPATDKPATPTKNSDAKKGN